MDDFLGGSAPTAIYSTPHITGRRHLDLDSLPQHIEYNPDRTTKHIDVTDRDGTVFRQTWTWENGRLAGVSEWVRQ